MLLSPMNTYFHLDGLAWLMMGLVGFIALCVGGFASRYLQGDSLKPVFFRRLVLLVGALLIMVSADHLAVLLGAWCVSNYLLARLMIHHPRWRAARASGRLAAATLGLGTLCMAGAFLLLSQAAGTASIAELNRQVTVDSRTAWALGLLLVGALTQSAIWPFHRWLLSSLNAPSPVSALMHAGLVNGGGFLIARFAPLYLGQPWLLDVMVALGLLTALLGTLWKLMQHDIKRMLACSTMGQMGFMLVQCGLGLFPAAVSHMIWHGMFKAYLFLASGSAAQEKRLAPGLPPSAATFATALLCGLLGSYAFALASGHPWMVADTSLVLVAIAFIAAAQSALTLMREGGQRRLPLAVAGVVTLGLAYGGSLRLVSLVLAPMDLMQPQPLGIIHVAGLLLLALAWLATLLGRTASGQRIVMKLRPLYVAALNASQPHPATVTAHRNQYHYS